MSKSFQKNFITAFNKRTVCEVLREIYWSTKDLEIREKTIEAMGMAKRMDKKLRSYKHEWDKHEWEDLEDFESIVEERRVQYEKEEAEK